MLKAEKSVHDKGEFVDVVHQRAGLLLIPGTDATLKLVAGACW